MSTDLDLARRLIEARFPMNESERIDSAGSREAPLFVLARTRIGCIWRFRSDVAADTVRGLAKLAGREPALATPVVDAPSPERLTPMTRVLEGAGVPTEVTRELVLCNNFTNNVTNNLNCDSSQSEESKLRIGRAMTEFELTSILSQPSLLDLVTLDWKLRNVLRGHNHAVSDFEPIAELIHFTQA